MEELLKLKERIKFYHKRAMTLRSGSRTSIEQSYIDGQLELAQQLLADALQLEGGQEMVNVGENEMILKVVKLSDLKVRRERSEFESQVIEWCEQLDKMIAEAKRQGEDIPALQINNKKVTYGNFSNKVAKMRKAGKIDPAFSTAQRGDQFFLIKKVS